MKNNTIITIRYEIGTDGVEVGKKLAGEFGIPYYDNDIMADMMDTSENAEYYKKSGTSEKVDKSYGGIRFVENVDGVRYQSRNNLMFEEQSALTRKLAAQGSAVSISRCVDNILKDHPGLISVFIGADFETRVSRMMKKERTDEKSARALVKEIDRGRKTYYQHYTFKTWGQREDYDLCLDAEKLDADGMVAVIKAFVENVH